ncbi:hypothetical protein DMH04_32775 [Kibdelosporangium aridum]|uniref:Small secreted protein n=1 Tax=Kibdelosporangium aridum TaxID=2030 RepID=A0A428Z1G7_KIBAR|nr:bacteriophage spanin2 family protein [Kibdelosporangium aridum]RSM78645.1 hypothetical protein DMH04_32775 [Kibdelosporangium aridum]
MRSTKRLLAGVLGGGALIVALTGCGALQEAQQTAEGVSNAASTAQVCVEALRIAAFNPDTANPDAAVQGAQDAGKKLEDLAAKATDTNVDKALNDLATTMTQTTVADLANGPANWLKTKADQVAALTKACGGGGGN